MAQIEEKTVRAQSSAVPEAPAPQATVVTEHRTVPREAMRSGRIWRRTARWLGLVIFLIGAFLLGYVFREAWHGYVRFATPNFFENAFGAQLGRLPKNDYAAQIGFVVFTFGGEILKVCYLLLLGYLGSAIAAKGIQFFAASEAVIDEAVVADVDEEIE